MNAYAGGCGPLAFLAALPGGGLGRKRRATSSNCEECLSRSLTGGIFPPDAISSVDALNVIPDLVGRDDEEFLKYIHTYIIVVFMVHEIQRC